MRLQQRLAVIPLGMTVMDYVQFDGHPEETPVAEKITLINLRDRFLATQEASLEETTVDCIRLHLSKSVNRKRPRHQLHFDGPFPSCTEANDLLPDGRGRQFATMQPGGLPATIDVTLEIGQTKFRNGKLSTEGRDQILDPKTNEKPPLTMLGKVKNAPVTPGLDKNASERWNGRVDTYSG